jgi:hypothetical protein
MRNLGTWSAGLPLCVFLDSTNLGSCTMSAPAPNLGFPHDRVVKEQQMKSHVKYGDTVGPAVEVAATREVWMAIYEQRARMQITGGLIRDNCGNVPRYSACK